MPENSGAMTGAAKALYLFFSSFGLDAFVEYNVPDDAKLPYITYQLNVPGWRDTGMMYVRVWYRSSSFSEINAKVDEISAAIGECVRLPMDQGAVYLSPGTPYRQYQPMEGDTTLKVVYMNLNIQVVS